MSQLTEAADALSKYTEKNAEMLYRYSELIKEAGDNEEIKMYAWNEFKHIVAPYQDLLRKLRDLERGYLQHKKQEEEKIVKKHDLPDWMVKSDPHAVAEGFYDFDHKPPFTSGGVPYEVKPDSHSSQIDPEPDSSSITPEPASTTPAPDPDPAVDSD